MEHDMIATEFSSFENYTGADADDTASSEVTKQATHPDGERLKIFDTLHDLRDHLGEEPVLKQIAIIPGINISNNTKFAL